jgi:hypothetical protein
MVPSLANEFGNGQCILIGLCMTQGDTVGGAFITMKMRLVRTLLGKINQIFLIKEFRLYCRFNLGLCDICSGW